MKSILHLDMDAFFASVEVRDNPALKGKPVIIGALPGERGVVSTCSYEARAYGVHSGMSIKDAYMLCPDGIYLHGSYHKYAEASHVMHSIMLEYSDRALFIASDEGYLDLTDSLMLFGSAESIGREIKKRVSDALSLSCSVGIGYNMMSAKLASEEKKPDGFFVIPDEKALQALIIDRPVRILGGVGSKTEETLRRYNIRTVRDLLSWSQEDLRRYLGDSGASLYQKARGIDLREIPVKSEASKSYGREVTFQEDLTSFEEMESALRLIARELATNLQRAGSWCGCVTLKLKYNNMKLHTRALTLDAPSNDADVIYRAAASLLRRSGFDRPVRLIGIQTSRFTDSPSEQLSLEDDPGKAKKESLNKSLLSLYERFGAGIIRTGAEIESEKILYPKE